MSTTSATFCPQCANLLLLEQTHSGLRFCCATCPFVYDITKGVRALLRRWTAHTRLPHSRRGVTGPAARLTPVLGVGAQIKHKVPTQNKEVDDVLGGDEAWATVDSTEGASPLPTGGPPLEGPPETGC